MIFEIIFFIFFLLIVLTIFYSISSEETTVVSSGSFNSFIGNEIIVENNDLKKYILEAQNLVSKIITEDLEIPLCIKRCQLGNGILAQAKMYNPYNVRSGGIITLNTVKLDRPERWIKIIVHEILHILGVGSSEKWQDGVENVAGNNYLNRIIFHNSSRHYDNLIRRGKLNGTIGDAIPLSDINDSVDDGGAHLDERIFNKEIMTPIADDENIISSLSIALLEDLGFEVDYNINEDEFF